MRCIYNSRNQCGLLDTQQRLDTTIFIYNSRNQCCLLDDPLNATDAATSTIVEISVVCQTGCRLAVCCLNLQQQKLVWSVRQAKNYDDYNNIYNSRNQCGLLDKNENQITESYLQQQKLVWSVRHDLMEEGRLVSTIVEISVVCQTPPSYQSAP